MALSDFIQPSRKVSIGNTECVVRGITASDVSFIINRYSEPATIAFDRFFELVGENMENLNAEVVKLFLTFRNEFPDLVAQIVACACDEPDQAHVFKMLPVSSQLELTIAMIELTFMETGAVKKFVEEMILLGTFSRGAISECQEAISSVRNTRK